jgi:hypothetical protein
MEFLWLGWLLSMELGSLAMLPLVREPFRPSLPTGSWRRV